MDPDLVADFTALPFPDDQFHLVVFDPPHIQRNGDTSWMLKKYGVLRGNWREEIRKGFAECFRVLKPLGTLVCKWNEDEVSVPEILSLTPEKPLFGARYGKHFKSHWIVFMKPNTKVSDGGRPRAPEFANRLRQPPFAQPNSSASGSFVVFPCLLCSLGNRS